MDSGSEKQMSLSGHGQRRTKRTFEQAENVQSVAAKDEHAINNNVRAEDNNVDRAMNDLRLLARQNYLSRREKQKFELLVHELQFLEDDARKYGLEELSDRERADLELKRELVKTIQEKNRVEDSLRDSGFQLQDDYIDDKGKLDTERKREILLKRVKQDDSTTRQQEWEENQIQKAVKNTAGDSDGIHIEGADKYEYAFDPESIIDFTADNVDAEPKDDNDEYEDKLLEEIDVEQKRLLSIQETRKLLPVYQYREDLLKAVKEHQVLIIVGETGSGKTTQLPQYLVEDGYTQGNKYQIAVTQPRRVAATSVATRVSDEMNVVLGKEVGYSIRFEDRTTPEKTILRYMTDGMLLREFLIDPELTKYSCIMIDEAHERTLSTDILLGLLKEILPHRKDLKLLISSATMNATKFSKFFGDCPIFNIPGRRYPVDIHYTLQPEANYLQAAITTIFQIHTSQPLPGDILVFLTGQDEIERSKEKLELVCDKLGDSIPQMVITPVYANLPQEQQEKIFQPTPDGCRKVVLATNIAETSLTIDGIKYVIDPGFVKEKSFVPSTGMSQLLTVACSRASVDQRAGRAGRVGPGKCFRLFTKWSYYHELELMPKPEILRTNLSQTVLLLLSLGIADLLNFPLLDKPSIPMLTKSLENLYTLGALNSKGTITKIGRIMCEFPCEPEFAKVIYTSATHELCKGTLEECLTIVAMLHETGSIFSHAQRKGTSNFLTSEVDSDHFLYLEIYTEWSNNNFSRMWCQDHGIQYKSLCRVRNIRAQLWQCSDRLGLVALNNLAMKELSNEHRAWQGRIIKSFIAGLPMNIAQLGTGGYRTMGQNTQGGLTVNVHPSSIVFKRLKQESKKPTKHILYQQLVLTSKEFIRDCLPIPTETWLSEMVPHLFPTA